VIITLPLTITIRIEGAAAVVDLVAGRLVVHVGVHGLAGGYAGAGADDLAPWGFVRWGIDWEWEGEGEREGGEIHWLDPR
jgi:hypothetical protein